MTEPNTTFTTASKNGMRKKSPSPIRQRCLDYINILKQMGYEKTIPLDEATEIFQNEMGIFDGKSLRAYFGTRAGRTEHTIDEMKRYQNGEVKLRTINLSYRRIERRGYLETLGLVEFQKVGRTWLMLIQSEIIVPLWNPQLCESQCQGNSSIPDLSLSPNRLQKDLFASPDSKAKDDLTIDLETTHTTQREREKSSLLDKREEP